MKIIYFISLIFLSTTCLAQYKTFVFEEAGLKLSYDKTWTLQSSEGRITIHVPRENRQDVEHENLGISISPTYGMSLDDAYSRYILESFPSTFKNFKIISEGVEGIDDVESKWIIFSFLEENIKKSVTNLIQLMVSEDSLLIVIGYATTEKFPEYEDSFRSITRSIDFIN